MPVPKFCQFCPVYQGAEKESQDATDQSSRELGKLRDWIRELQDACRIVLKGKPQLLEKVGILVRSSKPSRNKETGGSGEQETVSP